MTFLANLSTPPTNHQPASTLKEGPHKPHRGFGMQLVEIIWIVLGILLILCELFLTNFIVIFFGTSAVATGIAMWLGMPTTYGLPYFLFVALTTFQILFLRSKCKKIFLGDSEEPDKDEDFINQTATALLDFSQTPDSQHNHHGRVFFRGTEWNASSNTPINQNQRVIIERRKGSTLFVNPI